MTTTNKQSLLKEFRARWGGYNAREGTNIPPVVMDEMISRRNLQYKDPIIWRESTQNARKLFQCGKCKKFQLHKEPCVRCGHGVLLRV